VTPAPDTHSARDAAESAVAAVADSPDARFELLCEIYATRAENLRRMRFRRAAAAFMKWQMNRGLLNDPAGPAPGSPWWRAVNAALLRDTYEARELAIGRPGSPSSPAVAAGVEFIVNPTAACWYRAHNISVAQAYLANEHLAQQEGRVERFFLNLVLLRVLFAHALVAAPKLALSWLGPIGPLVGDPRVGMTGIFLSLSRVLPDQYPLGEDVERYVANEHGFGHALDVGIITPRVRPIYEWSAVELGLPALVECVHATTPSYAWDPADSEVWQPKSRRLAALARNFVRPVRKSED
jgi:hypothetical protein